MNRVLSIVVATTLAAAGPSAGLLAAAPQSITLKGTAYTAALHPLPHATVQIRDLKDGARILSAMSDARGTYTFEGLQPGTYIIEIVDAAGRVLGTSAPFKLGDAPLVTVSVVSAGSGAAVAGKSAGFNVLGMGPVTSLVVMGAASAAAVTAVVATRPDASPSR
jgi:hypothetical protein